MKSKFALIIIGFMVLLSSCISIPKGAIVIQSEGVQKEDTQFPMAKDEIGTAYDRENEDLYSQMAKGETKWSALGTLDAGEIGVADTLLVLDTSDTSMAGTGTQKQYAWSSLKSDMKDYTDTLYPPLSISSSTSLITLSSSGCFKIGNATDSFDFCEDGSGNFTLSITDGSSDGNIWFSLGTMTIEDEGDFAQTGTSDGDYFNINAYDVNGTAYQSLLRPVASNTPHLEIGPPTNFLKVAQDGTVTFEGTAGFGADEVKSADINTIVDSIVWDAAAIIADGTQCSAATSGQINSGPYISYIVCTSNDSASMYGSVDMPDSWDAGTVTFELTIIDENASPGDYYSFDVAAMSRGSSDSVDSTWGSESGIDFNLTSGVAQHDIVTQTSGAVTVNGATAGDTLFWRIQVDAGGTDATVANIYIHQVKMEYTSNVGD